MPAKKIVPAVPKRLNLVRIDVGASEVDVCPRTVRRWIAEGRLTGYRLGPKLLRVDLDELHALARPVPTWGK